MSTQPNLDFYAHVPTPREVAHKHLAELRYPMYAWRSDASETVFDPTTGALQPQRHLYSPQPTEHHNRTGRINSKGTSQFHTVDEGRRRDSSSSIGGVREENGGGEFSNEGTDDGDDTIWASAANTTGDRRRWWWMTNFTFSSDYFGTRGTKASMSTLESNPYNESGVYTPYWHDTIVFCKPAQRAKKAGDASTDSNSGVVASVQGRQQQQQHRRRTSEVVLAVTCNAAEALARELKAAEDAKNGEMLSLSSLSPVPRIPAPKKTTTAACYAFALSPTHCFDEKTVTISRSAAASAPAAAAAGKIHSSFTSAPYTAVDGVAQPSTTSLDEEMSTPSDAKLTPRSNTATGGSAAQRSPPHSRYNKDLDTFHSNPATTWCNVVGPTMASKQRVLTMAEDIYSDLIAREAQRTGSACGSDASLCMAAVPTSELVYSLRASYMHTSSPQSTLDRNGHCSHGSPHNSQHHHRNIRSSTYNHNSITTTTDTSRNLLPRSAADTTMSSLPSKIAGASSTVASWSGMEPGVSHRHQQRYPSSIGNHNNLQVNYSNKDNTTNSSREFLRRRPSSANTALSNSGKQGSSYEKVPLRRTATAIGVSSPVGTCFPEEEERERNDDVKAAPKLVTETVLNSGGMFVPSPHLPPPLLSSTSHVVVAAEGHACALPTVTLMPTTTTTATTTDGVDDTNNNTTDSIRFTASTLQPSPPLPLRSYPPVRVVATERSNASFSEAAASPTISAASPPGFNVLPPNPTAVTTPPTLSQYELEREIMRGSRIRHRIGNYNGSTNYNADNNNTSSDSRSGNVISHQANCNGARAKDSPLVIHGISKHHRASCNTVSPKSEAVYEHQQTNTTTQWTDSLLATQRAAGNGRNGGNQRRQCTMSLPPTLVLRRSSFRHTGRKGECSSSSRSRSKESKRNTNHRLTAPTTNRSPSRQSPGREGTRRLPAEAKETRVYAVRVRTTFTNADASSSLKWRGPLRRGVPVLLPDDWK